MRKKINRILASVLVIFAVAFAVFGQITNDDMWDMTRAVQPFRVVANVYYVGTNDVASYLITSDEGHILIDGGFEETVPLIEASVKKLGFDLKDIRIILNNHAHFDHCGGLKALKDKTGARLLAVDDQAELLASGGSTDFRFGGKQIFQPVKVDKIIKEGEIVSLGGNQLTTLRTAGHTKGSTTWTMDVVEDGRDLKVIFVSSLSTLDYNLIDDPKYQEEINSFRARLREQMQATDDYALPTFEKITTQK